MSRSTRTCGNEDLIDTTAYVAFKRNVTPVVEHLTRSRIVLFSPTVLAELLFGFRCGTKFSKNMEELDYFLSHGSVELVPMAETTADRYSRIAADLKRCGTPVPTNDIWIAASALEHGAELLTTDRHFEKIRGLVYTLYNSTQWVTGRLTPS